MNQINFMDCIISNHHFMFERRNIIITTDIVQGIKLSAFVLNRSQKKQAPFLFIFSQFHRHVIKEQFNLDFHWFLLLSQNLSSFTFICH